MRDRYMELHAECAQLVPAILAEEAQLNTLEQREIGLHAAITECRDYQAMIMDSLDPDILSIIEFGRQLERNSR